MTTISKVAELAGVSRTTVSHVINHAERVSPQLRARVEAAIAELGYEPNSQARSLRTGRTNLIAMLIPDILNPFFTEMVKAVQDRLEQDGLDTLIFNTDVPGGHSQILGDEYLQQIHRRGVDGLIVDSFALHGMLDCLGGLSIPTVFMGILPEPAVDIIERDNYGAARQMAEYLLAKGHTRIAMITGPTEFPEAMIRKAGFADTLQNAGHPLDPALVWEGTYLQPSGREAVRWLCEYHGADMPSAVLFGNSLMAIGGLTEFYDRKINVPKDIAVATFDHIAQHEDIRPRLTTVGNSPAELGRQAAETLVERLNGLEGDPRKIRVPCILQAHETA